MSLTDSGADIVRPCDPADEIHYALTERAEMGLRTVSVALVGLAQLAETPADELGPYVEPIHLSAIFRVLADHTAILLNTATAVTPAALQAASTRPAQGGLQ
jgi:hypothetical protein